MIDRAALEKLAARHLASMQSESGISLLLHRHKGARHTVHGFEEVSYITTIGFHPQWTAKKPS